MAHAASIEEILVGLDRQGGAMFLFSRKEAFDQKIRGCPSIHDHGLMNRRKVTLEADRKIPQRRRVGRFQQQDEPVSIFRDNSLMRAFSRLPDARLAQEPPWGPLNKHVPCIAT